MPDYRVELQQSDAAVRRRTPAPEPSLDQGPKPHPLVHLQSQVGNAQVARLLAQRQEVPEEEELQTKRDPALSQRQEVPEEEDLQTKRDTALFQRQEVPEEEELQTKRDLALSQRQEPEEEEEELQTKRDRTLQRQAATTVGLEGGQVGDDLTRRIDAARGAGSGLSDATRNSMESALGADFSSVRVHQDQESDTLARSMTAKAFTTGSDVFLRQDVNAGDSSLIAHELTHVVQQGSGVTGSVGSQGMHVGPADDPLEHQADTVAQAVVSGAAAQRRLQDGQAI